MWKTELKDYTFHSEECYENYLMLIEHPEYNYGVQLASAKDQLYTALTNSITGTVSATTAIEKLAPAIQAIADNLDLGN